MLLTIQSKLQIKIKRVFKNDQKKDGKFVIYTFVMNKISREILLSINYMKIY